MKVIYNKLLPFKSFNAVNLFGVIFARKGAVIDRETLNHEAIHSKQMIELLFIGFYSWYVTEWLIKIFVYRFNLKQAYQNIGFEREAYLNEHDFNYIRNRKRFAFVHYLKKQ